MEIELWNVWILQNGLYSLEEIGLHNTSSTEENKNIPNPLYAPVRSAPLEPLLGSFTILRFQIVFHGYIWWNFFSALSCVIIIQRTITGAYSFSAIKNIQDVYCALELQEICYKRYQYIIRLCTASLIRRTIIRSRKYGNIKIYETRKMTLYSTFSPVVLRDDKIPYSIELVIY